jgi:pimeloyl-ACP methyl ester carboxylesterase
LEQDDKMQFPELEYYVPYDKIKLKSNTSMAYTDTGAGEEVLLFIHGLASYLPSWKKLIPLLSSRFRCIAIDLPGYGKSQCGVNPGTMSYYSDVVFEFIETMNLKSVYLAGHSMGGQVSITTALRHPGFFKGLILLAPAGIEVFEEWEKNFIIVTYDDELVCSGSDDLISRNMQFNFFSMPEDARFLTEDGIKMKEFKNFESYREVIKNNVRAMLEEPVAGRLSEIKIPVQIIFGKSDMLIPNMYLHKKMSAEGLISFAINKIPHAKAEIIPACGHYIQLEKPVEAAGIIKKFLLH